MAEDPYLDSFRPGEGFPSGVEYRWSEGSGRDATTVSVSAPVYIEKVLQWIADQINDETKFPDDDDEAEVSMQNEIEMELCDFILLGLLG